MPGAVDVHVHLREPGFEYKETVKSGTMSCAKGGVTSIMSMPNLKPCPDCLDNLQVQLDKIETDAVVNVYPFGSVTVNEEDKELSNIDEIYSHIYGLSDEWVENKNGDIYWDINADSQENTEEGYRYLGPIIVVFNGSYNEILGVKKNTKYINGYLDGENAIAADVVVYGPNGENDVQHYTGFTLTSDFNKFGAIADGYYDVTYTTPGKLGKIKSNYAINNGNPVDCVGGINSSPKEYNPYSSTQKDKVYIHRTNNDGWAGWSKSDRVAISTGCLLILGTQWEQFERQIGKNDFKVKLIRQ